MMPAEEVNRPEPPQPVSASRDMDDTKLECGDGKWLRMKAANPKRSYFGADAVGGVIPDL